MSTIGDILAGYRVLVSYDADDGRVVLVDRGAQYAMRYVVGFHPRAARGWVDGVLHAAFKDALETYAVRTNHIATHRGCQCHAS